MKVYFIATEEPLSSRLAVMDEFGNPSSESLILYLNRADAERAADDYNEEILGEAAWVVELEVREKFEK